MNEQQTSYAAATEVKTKNGWRRKFKKTFRTIVFLFFALVGFLVYWFYFNVYSNGERKGTLIKITHKGNIFKTDEGEMWLSCRNTMNAEKFFFSAKNDSIAKVLENLQDECIQLTYKQYRATLPWRGDSKYMVTGVTKILPRQAE